MNLDKYKDPENFWERIVYFYDKNAKKLKRLFIFTGILVVLFIVLKTGNWAYQRYTFNSNLRRTTVQIAQLVDNVRTIYATSNENVNITQALLQENLVPDALSKNGALLNVYGGAVVVEKSVPIKDLNTLNMLPTFKFSYQGLSKETCVALSQINWGESAGGLIAVAIGAVKANGTDSALHDVDTDTNSGIKEFVSKDGTVKKIKTPARTLASVGRPHDEFNPIPFNLLTAESGCNCGKQLQCSFAMRYYLSSLPSDF